jgi:hypothetical protein
LLDLIVGDFISGLERDKIGSVKFRAATWGRMVSVSEIKNDLPGWEDDVIEQWLHYFANESDCGWPPPEPLGDHRWSRLLGGKPLSWWKNVTWKKEKLKCDLANLSPRARTGVNEILAEMISGSADEITRQRVLNSYKHFMDKGVFPRLLVIMKRPEGLSIIDGSHRMAAFEMLQRTPDAKFKSLGKIKAALEQQVWVGTHSEGELPNN